MSLLGVKSYLLQWAAPGVWDTDDWESGIIHLRDVEEDWLRRALNTLAEEGAIEGFALDEWEVPEPITVLGLRTMLAADQDDENAAFIEATLTPVENHLKITAQGG